MHQKSVVAAALGLASPASALLRFGCSQLTLQRLDPLVNPGQAPSTHLHQIIGGNAFNVTMDPNTLDIPKAATCTTCSFSEDFSNYWTATIFFRARNGSLTRVPQKPQQGFEGSNGGGMVVYYMSDALFDTAQKSKVTAFKPGFRMLLGDAAATDFSASKKYRQLSYTCMASEATRNNDTPYFPKSPCPHGIMINHYFPTCWDGKNLDSPDHRSHMSYPVDGTFESGAPCPATHPVKVPQILLETVWDTSKFNNKADWPVETDKQPFLWSTGDTTGYASHADYVFGWKDDSLQRAMDKHAYVTGSGLKTQSIAQQNKCSVPDYVKENLNGWMDKLPGGMSPM
ncbi:hypothetical protein QBC47DRAFT_422632 [Echria macrotheca]|uniref:DUF1996 domain-containing protein n=1 Tax=Echria macrotheca TaxID=438768 RepID=A0AAJ0BGA9_9PEZI|nr:hypothetical protein QBC47DRAFT_422632 [Echria macrotheca]